VLNLAAGLDARPYRMMLRPSLRWVEVDLPPIIEWKSRVLADATPNCRLERVALDLADVPARRALFARLASESKRALVLSQGLLIYLGADGAGSLADDLPFPRWVVDVCSPGLRDLLNREVGKHLDAASAPLKFAPPNGPRFFEAHGWRVVDVRSMLKHAPSKRLPWLLRVFKRLPEGRWDKLGRQPWSAVCLLERT
jgi:O-methyltransferase involved in polyketide biosynthesis